MYCRPEDVIRMMVESRKIEIAESDLKEAGASVIRAKNPSHQLLFLVAVSLVLSMFLDRLVSEVEQPEPVVSGDTSKIIFYESD